MIFFALLIVLFSVSYLWVERRFRFWKDRGFIQGDPSFPWGTFKGATTERNLAEHCDHYYKKFKGKGPAVGLYNLLSPVILPLEPQLVKNIFVRDFQSFHDRAFYYNKEDDPLSANLLTLEGQDWKDRRVKMTPIFTSGKMKMMFEIINGIGDKFIEIVEQETRQQNEVDMRKWFHRLTADTIGNVAFGIEPNCLEDPNSDFIKFATRFLNRTFKENIEFLIGLQWPNLARKFGVRFVQKEVADFFIKIFKDTIDYREKNHMSRNDFVQLLLGLKNEYTKDELAAEAFLVYGGGYETSSSLMTYTLYEIALNPDIQDRLRQEITKGIEENDGKLTYDMLFKFKYLDMVINESLRKYPPVPNQFRRCTVEYKIPDTELVIPKGTVIQINNFSFQRDPEYFPEPEKFDPERFNDENVGNIRPYTTMPFGEGPRNCIGMRFGLMQSKLGIAKVVTNFKIYPSSKTPIPVKFVPNSPVLEPVGGMWLSLKKIN